MSDIKGLRILQANLDHMRAATEHLLDYSRAWGADFVIAGDSCTRAGSISNIPPSLLMFHDLEQPNVGILVVGARFEIFPVLLSPYVVALRCASGIVSFVLVGVYAAPGIPMRHILERVNEVILTSENQSVIVCGDFNAKKQLWGGGVTDARGAELIEFINQHQLCIVNDSHSDPTYSTEYVDGGIDLILMSQAFTAYKIEWKVKDTLTLSEHRYITFTIHAHDRP